MWNNKGADRKVKTHTEQTKKNVEGEPRLITTRFHILKVQREKLPNH